MNKRRYISIYFKDAVTDNRKKGYLTLSFPKDDEFYRKCKRLGATKIKQFLAVGSYRDLVLKASQEERSLGNYIKYILKKKLNYK